GRRRQGPAVSDSRPVEPMGLVHLGRFAVVLLATDSRATLRAGLSRSPRGGPSRRDEPFGAVLADRGADLPVRGARQKVAPHVRPRTAPVRNRGLISKLSGDCGSKDVKQSLGSEVRIANSRRE